MPTDEYVPRAWPSRVGEFDQELLFLFEAQVALCRSTELGSPSSGEARAA